MGDKTTVNLTIRKEDFTKYKALFDEVDDVVEQSSTCLLLDYYDVNYANLNFENVLQEKRIPYDKSWDSGDEYTCGTEYCRVLANGNVDVKQFSESNAEAVNLEDTIAAYKEGRIVEFLESKKNELAVMSWDDQEIIMQRRNSTEKALLNSEQENLDCLVVEMSCELSSLLKPIDESVLLAEYHGVEVNNQGKEEQISYLLNNGYLSEGFVKHIVPQYMLFNCTGDLWQCDDVQFPRLISELRANVPLSGESCVALKESMDLDDSALNDVFNRAHKAWEYYKKVI